MAGMDDGRANELEDDDSLPKGRVLASSPILGASYVSADEVMDGLERDRKDGTLAEKMFGPGKYVCNCGAVFDDPYARVGHMTECAVMRGLK